MEEIRLGEPGIAEVHWLEVVRSEVFGVWSDHCVSDADAGAGHVTSDNVGEICNLLLQLTDAGDLDMGDLRQVEQSQFPAFRAALAAAVSGRGWSWSVLRSSSGPVLRGWSWSVLRGWCGSVVLDR